MTTNDASREILTEDEGVSDRLSAVDGRRPVAVGAAAALETVAGGRSRANRYR